MIRSITGYGAGKGAYITIHDGFYGPERWIDFMRGADRTIMEMHPYFAFTGGPNMEPIATGTGITAGGLWPIRACSRWGGLFSDRYEESRHTSFVVRSDAFYPISRSSFGISFAGEWSSTWNDCGLFLNGIGLRATYGGDCEQWQDSTNWNASTKAGILQLGMATMDALDSWFFWTWKVWVHHIFTFCDTLLTLMLSDRQLYKGDRRVPAMVLQAWPGRWLAPVRPSNCQWNL